VLNVKVYKDCVCLCVFKEIIYNMDGMHLSMIINRKKKHKNTGNIIKEIIDIIEQNKVTVTTDDSFDSLLNNFVTTYIKLKTLVDKKKDEIENEQIIKNVIDEIITKVENNDFIVPELNKKKIEIKENCDRYYKKDQKDITIIMK
jgi:hypothetical protein